MIDLQSSAAACALQAAATLLGAKHIAAGAHPTLMETDRAKSEDELAHDVVRLAEKILLLTKPTNQP